MLSPGVNSPEKDEKMSKMDLSKTPAANTIPICSAGSAPLGAWTILWLRASLGQPAAQILSPRI